MSWPKEGVVVSGDVVVFAAGEVFDSAPYGWPLVKGSPLAPVLQRAMQHLIDGGQYQQIADNWGVGSGTITQSQINGAAG